MKDTPIGHQVLSQEEWRKPKPVFPPVKTEMDKVKEYYKDLEAAGLSEEDALPINKGKKNGKAKTSR